MDLGPAGTDEPRPARFYKSRCYGRKAPVTHVTVTLAVRTSDREYNHLLPIIASAGPHREILSQQLASACPRENG